LSGNQSARLSNECSLNLDAIRNNGEPLIAIVWRKSVRFSHDWHNRAIALSGRYGGFAANEKVAMLPGRARLEICQRLDRRRYKLKATGESAAEGKRMSDLDMQAELERLRAENVQLKNKEKSGLTLKVSEKGAVSLYGMGRFPVTLYKEQWLRILGNASEIETFIRDNESRLKSKE
jgi:hypothetical protein